MFAGFERVRCKCPPYKGSDFWNDPHRWCGVDPEHEKVWAKSDPADCERTVKPKKPAPVRDNPYRQATPEELQRLAMLQYQVGMANQMQRAGLNSPLGSLASQVFGLKLF